MYRANKAVRAGVYITRSTRGKLYVGQTNNFARRAYQHARVGKINRSTPRLEIKVRSKVNRNKVERCAYICLGGKRAPWLENRISPPRR